ncbi:PKD domain-containing protein [Actinomyces sp. 594]|uniref:LamG-like jellyroll fold domain-containing protein n=1 Tax=Actinomyces sp. 594 TaxID=2057793 RepID=UPI001C569ACB|nr:LamG-like jellyroll fold domain-containing protein [Actinomyces sp. 594]MBW3069446.1 PKD domain-containing protein [Actinomyces sp. 594]
MNVSRVTRGLAAVVTTLCLALTPALVSNEALAAVDQASGRIQSNFTAQPLPTVQVDGVVWDQLVVGDVVYVVGQFNNARPAGAAAGRNETPRRNILAYDLNSGELIEDFAPELNNAGRSLALSPDRTTLYVAGSFDKVNGEWHGRVAAFDLTAGHGTLISTFRPMFSTTVNDIAVTETTVYAGGAFKTVNGVARTKLAAVDAGTGGTLDWAPSAEGDNSQVYAVAVSPDGSKVVAAGSFQTLNGSSNPGYGLALLSSADGSLLPAPVNDHIRNGGRNAALNDIAVDETGFYGVGWSQRQTEGRLEGAFKADWEGNLSWVEPCHGDSYGIVPDGDQVYVTNHAHSCETIYGFPDVTWQQNGTTLTKYYRAMAFTNSGEVQVRYQGTGGYYNWTGYTSPDIIDWYPDLTAGTFTGMGQAAYDVTISEDGQYLLMGGEFVRANGAAQQGLVRYARRDAANGNPPEGSGADLAFQARATATGVSFTFTPTWDRDDSTLTYSVYRDAESSPVASTTVSDRHWNISGRSLLDSGAPAGEHSYRLVVTDPAGNSLSSDPVTVTVGGAQEVSAYDQRSLDLGAIHLWTFDETEGNTLADIAGNADLTISSGVALGATGARTGSAAVSLSGYYSGVATSSVTDRDIQTFTVETWVRTSSRWGGGIFGYTSGSMRDRIVYMDTSGRIRFGVYPGAVKVITSPRSYNDNKWHHVVASLGPQGQRLYIDGEEVAADASVTSAQSFFGNWTLGVGSLSGWPGGSVSGVLAAAVDGAAVYPSQLSAEEVSAHYGLNEATVPTAAFTADTQDFVVTVDGSGSTVAGGSIASWSWDFGDGATGEGVTAAHTYAETGTYTIRLTVTSDTGATAASAQPVLIGPADPTIAADDFDRTAPNGWADAAAGGTWTVNPASRFSVADGTATIALNRAGSTATAALAEVSSDSTELTASYTLSEQPTGGGVYTAFAARTSGSSSYNLRIHSSAKGVHVASITAVTGAGERTLDSVRVVGDWSPGEPIHIRMRANGTGETQLSAKVWTGDVEPEGWSLNALDSSEELQAAGAIGIRVYTSASATSTTGTFQLSEFNARRADVRG